MMGGGGDEAPVTTTTRGGGCGRGPVIRVASGAQALAAGGALVTGTVAVAGWPVGATLSTEPRRALAGSRRGGGVRTAARRRP